VNEEKVPPSWEVLDEEARALELEISCVVDNRGNEYVRYADRGGATLFLDDPDGREAANEWLGQRASE
jgi:hypothetical protein